MGHHERNVGHRHGPPRGGRHVLIAVLVMLAMAGCTAPSEDFNPDAIIALERGALDRWGQGDPEGYFEIMAPDVTYFDPTTETRVDGIEALRGLFAPFTGKIKIDRIEMINPVVQRAGDLAVLTFNLISHGAQVGDGPKGDARWNSTEVYRRSEGTWRIIHSHWSYIKPALKERPAE